MKRTLFSFLVVTFLTSCAPSGPWMFSTEEQRDARLPKVGMSSSEMLARFGAAMRSPNDFAPDFRPGPGYTGSAYYQIQGLTLRVAEIVFEAGTVADVRYVPRQPRATTAGVLYADGEASEEPPLNVVTFARTCTWDGGGADALASNAVNWDTNVAPVAGDSIVFPTTTKSCTWDLNLSLVGFTINSGYVNTITQNSGANITLSATFAQNGACTFTCNAGATFTSAAFSVAAGTFNQGGAFVSTTFGCTGTGIYVGSSATMSTTAVTHSNTAALTATSGVWSVAGSWTKNNSPTFTHNSGTIAITAASTFGPAATLNLVTINTSASNGNVTLSSGTTVPLGASPTTSCGTGTLTPAGTITFSANWTHTGSMSPGATAVITGTSTPTLTITQSLTVNSSATITNAIGTLTFNGTTASTLTDTGDKLSGSTTVVTKGGNANFTVAASTTCRGGSAPSVVCGTSTFTVSGIYTWTGLLTVTGALTTSNGSTLTGSSTPTISIDRSVTINATTTITNAIGTITSTGSSTATITDTGDALSGSTWVINRTGQFAIAASTTVRLGSNPTIAAGSASGVNISGTLTASGTIGTNRIIIVNSGATMSGGFTGITFTGAGSLTVAAGGTFPNNSVALTFTASSTVTIDAAGITFLTSTINQTGINVVITAGTVALGNNPTTLCGGLTLNGTLTVSGVWTHDASFTLGATGVVSGALTELKFSTGTIDLSAAGTWPSGVNMTFQPLTSPRSFHGGGRTFGAFRRLGGIVAPGDGTATLTFNGSNTWTEFRDNEAVAAHGLTFTAGTTQTITGNSTYQYIIDGGANTVTISSTSGGSAYTLAFTGTKPVNLKNCAISDMTTSGAEVWAGPNCTGTASGTLKIAINPRLRKTGF